MKVSVSILNQIDNINEVILALNETNVDYIHMDVMDGVFVTNKTFDYSLIDEIKTKTNKVIDTHLMIVKPEAVIDKYLVSSDIITFHVEATNQVESIIEAIHKKQKLAGISIKPNTKVDEILKYLAKIDLVLVMTVEPGYGGQKFMEDMVGKVKLLKELKDKYNYHYVIETDGGINKDTSKLVKEAGCDIVVSGSYIFKGDIQDNINSIR